MSAAVSALVDALVDSHTALLYPVDKKPDRHYAFHVAVCSLTTFGICCAVHQLVLKGRVKREYMALHVFANVVMSALCLPGAVRALFAPQNSTVIAAGAVQPQQLFLCWVYALHIYHPLFFKTGRMDWVHHIPVYFLNTLTFSINNGDAICLQSLVMTGIPGGLDYLLQVFEGAGLMTRATYKGYCSAINNWIRAPFGAVSSYVSFLGLYHGWAFVTWWEAFVFAGLSVHAFWNPPFFGRQAIEANVVDCINRFGLPPGEIKLPYVRSLSGKPNKTPPPGYGSSKPASPMPPSKSAPYPIGADEKDHGFSKGGAPSPLSVESPIKNKVK